MRFSTTAPLALAALAAACASTKAAAPVGPEPSPYEIAVTEGQAFTLMVMRRGATSDVMGPREMGDLTSRHIEFTERMADSRYLLVSGPFVGNRVERDLRSMAIVDTTDTRGAFGTFCADPAAEAGVLEVEAIPFVAHDNMRAFPARERGFRASRGVDEFLARPYVICEGPASPEFRAALEQMDGVVLFSGDCRGGSFENRTLAALDCKTVSEAMDLMTVSTSLSNELRFHPWVSSVALAGGQ